MASQLAKHQPLLLQRRSDLIESNYECQGEPVTVIKDPVGLQYFHLEGADRCLLELLDGKRTLSDVCRELQGSFPESTVEEHTVHSGIQRFHQQGLLTSDATSQGALYLKRGDKQLREAISQFFSSILAMRFPGINPTRFLDSCQPLMRMMFHPITITLAMVYMLVATSALLVRLEEFYLETPRIAAFFSFENLPFFVATIFITKTVHEFGHAFVCHYLGAQAHAIGFMLLVLSPAAYCDASDSWMLPDKYHRIMIALAGMFFELVLAATAVFIWMATEPGWLHLFCVNLIIVSSVSTLVFNANPLLRYDGYYILSDYLEIPNMSKKANEYLLSVGRKLFLGMEENRVQKLPNRFRKTFITYAYAAMIYKWFIMGMIYWFLITFFEGSHIAVIGYLLVSVALVKAMWGPLTKLKKFFSRPGLTKEMDMSVAIPRILLAIGLLSAILFFPLPRYEHGWFVLRPTEFRTAYVASESVLKRTYVEPGDRVEAGELLAELENYDLRMSVATLESQLSQLQAEIRVYESFPDSTSTSPLSFQDKRSELRKVSTQLDERRQQLEKLQVLAPCAGIVLPPIDFGNSNDHGSDQRIDCFEPKTIGANLPPNTPVCSINASDRFDAVAYVNQRSMKRLAVGQTVRLLLDEYSSLPLKGTLTSIKSKFAQNLPAGLYRESGGYVEVSLNGEQREPRIPHFQLLIDLDDLPGGCVPQTGLRGQVKILVQPASLFARLREFVFRFSSFR